MAGELSPERAAQRERTRKRLRLNALENQANAIARMRFSPFVSQQEVSKAEKSYAARLEKTKAKYPHWFPGK